MPDSLPEGTPTDLADTDLNESVYLSGGARLRR